MPVTNVTGGWSFFDRDEAFEASRCGRCCYEMSGLIAAGFLAVSSIGMERGSNFGINANKAGSPSNAKHLHEFFALFCFARNPSRKFDYYILFFFEKSFEETLDLIPYRVNVHINDADSVRKLLVEGVENEIFMIAIGTKCHNTERFW